MIGTVLLLGLVPAAAGPPDGCAHRPISYEVPVPCPYAAKRGNIEEPSCQARCAGCDEKSVAGTGTRPKAAGAARPVVLIKIVVTLQNLLLSRPADVASVR